MTLNDFVKKYDGKKVDFDNAYGAQCVDLFRMYNKEVLELPYTGAVNGAKDIYFKFDELREKEFYERVIPTSAKAGDIAVWGASASNQFGHVAIVLGTLLDELVVFEQDGFKQDGAKIKVRSRENLAGILRKK